jgi:hypothetical protein
MTGNDVPFRVTFSEKVFHVVRHTKKTNFEHLVTENESWFYYEYHHDLAWAPSRATLTTRKAQKIQTNMPSFHYLVDVRHPQSFCFACQDVVGCGVFCSSVLLDI